MLKLTQWDGSGPQYVRPDAIKSMFWAHSENRTWINLGEADVRVKETPEEILAMPEMRAEIDRAKYAAYFDVGPDYKWTVKP